MIDDLVRGSLCTAATHTNAPGALRSKLQGQAICPQVLDEIVIISVESFGDHALGAARARRRVRGAYPDTA